MVGNKTLVAASSPDEFNVRKAKRTTFTRYLPAWEKHEYDALVSSWRKRVTDYESGSEEAKEITQRVNAAEMAFEWFGGIPWFLWDVEANGLTVEAFKRETKVRIFMLSNMLLVAFKLKLA
ncbi:hypothetical protein SELMODRAFT_428586 [Selaginella moellendorffii]|uniref:Uncharacterized protein n=1 Tax=Selaginella moellendorffii TaxID=88036 RepID=D8T3C1_SELML|nr:hypothetical protein SELMODRAFT_428586 [Selaginella moellendorffii]